MVDDISEAYVEYSKIISEARSLEIQLYNLKRLSETVRTDIINSGNGGIGIEFTGHAFKQISERLEALAMENDVIHRDVFKSDSADNLLLPSNLKPFIITLMANATTTIDTEKLKSALDYKYSIPLPKWSNEKLLHLICIVENNHIKTGYFNWVNERY